MAKVTEKAIKAAVLHANQNSKHLLVGLQMHKGVKFYTVNVVARKTGAAVQAFGELSASEAHEAITMFDLAARVTALQIGGLAGALEQVIEQFIPDQGLLEVEEQTANNAREALTKFRGAK